MNKTESFISITAVGNGNNDNVLGMFPGGQKMLNKSFNVATELIKTNFNQLIETLKTIVDDIPDTSSKYMLDTISFSLNIDATGKISLVGELSAGMNSGVVITIKRKT